MRFGLPGKDTIASFDGISSLLPERNGLDRHRYVPDAMKDDIYQDALTKLLTVSLFDPELIRTAYRFFGSDIIFDFLQKIGLMQVQVSSRLGLIDQLTQIHEIRAGAGEDIVDMTSQQFEYTGDGLTIRGGDGNDTIWANKGNNMLFGDAGNDRIVGASGNDVIAGGIGNDRMHGGEGKDTFTFCDNWGVDTVEQLGSGTVTLWFVSGSLDNWNASTLTYTDGDNSVTVKGVTSVELKFGENSPGDVAQFALLFDMGAFDAFTSQRIFEESGLWGIA